MDQLVLGSLDPAVFYEHTFVVGVDLGQSHDPTAICIVEKISGGRFQSYRDRIGIRYRPLYHVKHLERLPLDLAYPQQVAYVASLLRREPLSSAEPAVYVDYTGVGRPVFDIFQQERIPRVRGVAITGGQETTKTPAGWSVPKTQLVSLVQAKLHSGDLKVGKELKDAPALLRELQEFRVRFTTAGNATFGAREGAHDDLVLALALAVFGADQSEPVMSLPFRFPY